MEIRLRIARYLWSSSRETWTASGDLWERVLSTMSSSTSEYPAIFDLYKSSLISSGMRLNKRVYIIQKKRWKEKNMEFMVVAGKIEETLTENSVGGWQRTLWVCERELCGCVTDRRVSSAVSGHLAGDGTKPVGRQLPQNLFSISTIFPILPIP